MTAAHSSGQTDKRTMSGVSAVSAQRVRLRAAIGAAKRTNGQISRGFVRMSACNALVGSRSRAGVGGPLSPGFRRFKPESLFKKWNLGIGFRVFSEAI